MFAELDANGYAVIIGAVVLGVIQVAREFFSYFERRAVREAVKLEARKVRRRVIRENKVAQADRGKIAVAVEEIHKATNGLKTELVNEVRQASFAKGEKSEQDKHTGTALPAGAPVQDPPIGTIREAIHKSGAKVEEAVKESAEDIKKTIQEER